jgi:hypothetical protein
MFEQAFKNIDDVLWKEAGCTTELDYTEQTSWLLFLSRADDDAPSKATQGVSGFAPAKVLSAVRVAEWLT